MTQKTEDSETRATFVEPVTLDRGPFLTDPTLTAALVEKTRARVAEWTRPRRVDPECDLTVAIPSPVP